MKLIAGLLSCLRPAVVAVGSSEEDERATVNYKNKNHTSNRVIKRRGGGSNNHWRPALMAISEEGVVLVCNNGGDQGKKAVTKIKVKAPIQQKPLRNKTNKNESPSRIGSKAMEMVIPTFSPTPFVF